MILPDRSSACRLDQSSSLLDPWRSLPRAEIGFGERLPAWARVLAPVLPRTTAAMLELDRMQRTFSPLPPKLRAQMRWVAATANRSDYGAAYAETDLRRAGASSDEIKRLSDDLSARRDADAKALRFAQMLTLEAYKISDDDVAELLGKYGDANVVAMVQLLAYANFQDRLLHALGIAIEPDGPLPPPTVRFAHPFAGAAVPPPRTAPTPSRGPTGDSARIEDPEWQKLDFDALQRQIESQRGREPRIPIPSFQSIRDRMANLFPPDKELKIKWSLVCLGYQPELAQAWTLCTRTYAEEANLDRFFEESLFWVVTRSLQCFY